MALLAGLTTVRYYTAADPYYYAIDNRPLVDIAASLAFLATSIDTGPIRTGDGTVGSPAYSFISDPTTGLFRNGGGAVSFASAGVELARVSQSGTGTIKFRSDGLLGWSPTSNPSDVGDLILARDAANVLAQRNGVNAQTLRVYNTFTDSANYERIVIGAGIFGANSLGITTDSLGTGTARNLTIGSVNNVGISFVTNNIGRLSINNAGNIVWPVDNTLDIGALGATRPRHLYLGGRYVGAIATVTYSASMTPDAATGNQQTITATNNTAFTINAPSNPASGQKLIFTIRNTSGGALGVATWNAVFKMATWTQPATANSRSVTFFYDGTNWIETARTTADIPN